MTVAPAAASSTSSTNRIICALDIGGTNAKARCAHWDDKRATPSGLQYTPQQLVADMGMLLGGQKVDAITIGLPTPIKNGRPLRDPVNLGPGWKDFDYRAAFGVPVKLLNDAAMQAIGSHRAAGLTNERMLFLGLGTGLGSCMIVGRNVLPMELAHLPFRNVAECARLLHAALLPDVVVLGGGNSKALKEIPSGCVLGANSNAFLGGYAVWEPDWAGAATEL